MNVTIDEQISFTLDFLRVNGQTTLLGLVRHMNEENSDHCHTHSNPRIRAKNRSISLRPVDNGNDIMIMPGTFAHANPSVEDD